MHLLHGYADPVLHLAGTLATKEAVIKAASLGPLVFWCRRIEVKRGWSGAPTVKVDGETDREIRVSISHDKGMAVAVAILSKPLTERDEHRRIHSGLSPNLQLTRYLASGLTG